MPKLITLVEDEFHKLKTEAAQLVASVEQHLEKLEQHGVHPEANPAAIKDAAATVKTSLAKTLPVQNIAPAATEASTLPSMPAVGHSGTVQASAPAAPKTPAEAIAPGA